ncbi:response regulator transcription factor [Blautia sp. XA-2221]|uniref:response regulator transcription factor n=1 Tax=Blautia sp. XA-2221 TaxID=2903961 RepID=UPI002379EF87|nr:response regulator [Blautia sp. XA-2221]
MWRVAAADDEAYLRTALKKLMNWEKMGCELISVVNNGRELIQCIEEEHPDIVITDIRMPEADGLEVCRYIYEQYPEIQTIILSAYTDFEYARTALRYDVADYVLKLSILEELPPAVQKVTGKLEKQKKELEEEFVNPPRKKEAEGLYEQVNDYIQRNYSRKITLNDIAQELHANSSYLSRLYKKESGMNLFDVVLQKRIEKAKEYMEDTDRKIYEISQAVGFDDTGYFSRVFKKYSGMSPREYQNRKRGTHEEK